MGVKIADGQTFHVGEKLDAQIAQRALRDVDHDAGIQPCGQNTDGIDAADPEQSRGQGAEIRGGLLDHGDDVIIDQRFQEEAGLNIGQCADDDADENDDAVGQIVLEHFAHDPLEQQTGIFHFGSGLTCTAGAGTTNFFCLCHYCSPPCLSKSPPPCVWLL